MFDREALHKRLDAWLDEAEKVQPDIENGEEMTLKFTAAVYDTDDSDNRSGRVDVESTRREPHIG